MSVDDSVTLVLYRMMHWSRQKKLVTILELVGDWSFKNGDCFIWINSNYGKKSRFDTSSSIARRQMFINLILCGNLNPAI